MPFVLEGMPNSFLFITVSALMENCEFLDIAKIFSVRQIPRENYSLFGFKYISELARGDGKQSFLIPERRLPWS